MKLTKPQRTAFERMSHELEMILVTEVENSGKPERLYANDEMYQAINKAIESVEEILDIDEATI